MRRNVELGTLQGKRRAIRSVTQEEGQPVKAEDQPITAEDEIIVTGLQRLRSGMAVTPEPMGHESPKTGSPEPAEL